jgi:hypothetical protein
LSSDTENYFWQFHLRDPKNLFLRQIFFQKNGFDKKSYLNLSQQLEPHFLFSLSFGESSIPLAACLSDQFLAEEPILDQKVTEEFKKYKVIFEEVFSDIEAEQKEAIDKHKKGLKGLRKFEAFFNFREVHQIPTSPDQKSMVLVTGG